MMTEPDRLIQRGKELAHALRRAAASVEPHYTPNEIVAILGIAFCEALYELSADEMARAAASFSERLQQFVQE